MCQCDTTFLAHPACWRLRDEEALARLHPRVTARGVLAKARARAQQKAGRINSLDAHASFFSFCCSVFCQSFREALMDEDTVVEAGLEVVRPC